MSSQRGAHHRRKAPIPNLPTKVPKGKGKALKHLIVQATVHHPPPEPYQTTKGKRGLPFPIRRQRRHIHPYLVALLHWVSVVPRRTLPRHPIQLRRTAIGKRGDNPQGLGPTRWAIGLLLPPTRQTTKVKTMKDRLRRSRANLQGLLRRTCNCLPSTLRHLHHNLPPLPTTSVVHPNRWGTVTKKDLSHRFHVLRAPRRTIHPIPTRSRISHLRQRGRPLPRHNAFPFPTFHGKVPRRRGTTFLPRRVFPGHPMANQGPQLNVRFKGVKQVQDLVDEDHVRNEEDGKRRWGGNERGEDVRLFPGAQPKGTFFPLPKGSYSRHLTRCLRKLTKRVRFLCRGASGRRTYRHVVRDIVPTTHEGRHLRKANRPRNTTREERKVVLRAKSTRPTRDRHVRPQARTIT